MPDRIDDLLHERGQKNRRKARKEEARKDAHKHLQRLEGRVLTLLDERGEAHQAGNPERVKVLNRKLDATREEIERTHDQIEKLSRVIPTLKDAIERITRLIKALKRKRAEARLDWPETAVFAELLYHDPPHLHVAMTDRDKLITICRIAEEEWGLTVSEFPPFDSPVECVHTTGSWHYRDSSSPFTARTCAGQGNGLAADINGTREFEFFQELQRRY